MYSAFRKPLKSEKQKAQDRKNSSSSFLHTLPESVLNEVINHLREGDLSLRNIIPLARTSQYLCENVKNSLHHTPLHTKLRIISTSEFISGSECYDSFRGQSDEVGVESGYLRERSNLREYLSTDVNTIIHHQNTIIQRGGMDLGKLALQFREALHLSNVVLFIRDDDDEKRLPTPWGDLVESLFTDSFINHENCFKVIFLDNFNLRVSALVHAQTRNLILNDFNPENSFILNEFDHVRHLTFINPQGCIHIPQQLCTHLRSISIWTNPTPLGERRCTSLHMVQHESQIDIQYDARFTHVTITYDEYSIYYKGDQTNILSSLHEDQVDDLVYTLYFKTLKPCYMDESITDYFMERDEKWGTIHLRSMFQRKSYLQKDEMDGRQNSSPFFFTPLFKHYSSQFPAFSFDMNPHNVNGENTSLCCSAHFFKHRRILFNILLNLMSVCDLHFNSITKSFHCVINPKEGDSLFLQQNFEERSSHKIFKKEGFLEDLEAFETSMYCFINNQQCENASIFNQVLDEEVDYELNTFQRFERISDVSLSYHLLCHFAYTWNDDDDDEELANIPNSPFLFFGEGGISLFGNE